MFANKQAFDLATLILFFYGRFIYEQEVKMNHIAEVKSSTHDAENLLGWLGK